MAKKFKNVVEMVEKLEGKEKAEKFEKLISVRKISKYLFSLRCNSGLSNPELAKKANISILKINKLQMKEDKDITIGELVKFCNALGVGISIQFQNSVTGLETVIKPEV